jgi:hypothetical protein
MQRKATVPPITKSTYNATGMSKRKRKYLSGLGRRITVEFTGRRAAWNTIQVSRMQSDVIPLRCNDLFDIVHQERAPRSSRVTPRQRPVADTSDKNILQGSKSCHQTEKWLRLKAGTSAIEEMRQKSRNKALYKATPQNKTEAATDHRLLMMRPIAARTSKSAISTRPGNARAPLVVNSSRASWISNQHTHTKPNNANDKSTEPDDRSDREMVFVERFIIGTAMSNAALQRPGDHCASSKLSMRRTLMPVRCKRLLCAQLMKSRNLVPDSDPEAAIGPAVPVNNSGCT